MAPAAKPFGASRLEINLDTPSQGRRLYVPGEVLEGEIVLYNPYHAAGLEASVTFSGVSKVRFKEKGRLFSPVHTHEDEFLSVSRTNLARAMRQDAVFWKFRIPIPSYMSKSSARFADNESFAKVPGSSLPPSFDALGQGNGFRQLERSNVDPHGKVIYTLAATLTKPFFTHSYVGPTICQMQLPLSSLRSLKTGTPALQTISFHYHDIALDKLYDFPGELGDVRRALARDNRVARNCSKYFITPSITIKTSISIAFMTEQPLEVALYFHQAIPKYAREKLSPPVLHALNVEIFSQIQARAPSALRCEPRAEGGKRRASYSLDGARLPTSQSSYQLPGEKYSGFQWNSGDQVDSGCQWDSGYQWDIGALVQNSSTTSIDTPTFKTSNLSLSYTIHVRAEFSVCDRKISFDVRKPLLVEPRFSRGDVLPSKKRIGTSHAEGEKENEGDAPPPYSEHQGTTPAPALPGEQIQLPSYQTTLDEKR